ncbi:MFS transporter [Nocardiopsis akebiae]|uniref:MFS transporter n=1 Tax=Nocardiopsis akebiae TaxID=2831968 RepID=A0ABX8C7K8_9ACTN|nr:MFS transporter [Nocardiopsis akebiae]QUX28888.1 MFS transporter [Nocardiopsis akebiae]
MNLHLPYLIGPLLLLLVGLFALVCCFAAAPERRALTGLGAAALLASSVLSLLDQLSSPWVRERVADSGTTALITGVSHHLSALLLGAGMLLLVVAAARRTSRAGPPPPSASPYGGPHEEARR